MEIVYNIWKETVSTYIEILKRVELRSAKLRSGEFGVVNNKKMHKSYTKFTRL